VQLKADRRCTLCKGQHMTAVHELVHMMGCNLTWLARVPGIYGLEVLQAS